MRINSICVFCGSNYGNTEVYREQATLLGKCLAENGRQLVYGGAHVGLMGAVADGAIKAGGEVIGVIPRFLQAKELAHTGLSALILVDTMHERKAIMNERCDAVIALPGGFGTMDELFEMLTWSQLDIHKKPIGILNINGYYDSLILLVEDMVAKGFLKSLDRDQLIICNDIETLIFRLVSYVAPTGDRLIAAEKI